MAKECIESMGFSYSLAGKRIFVAGHAGMVGGAVMRRLEAEECEVLTISRADMDLRDGRAVAAWMEEHKPDVVILAAARVGGIGDNAAHPAEFFYDNMMISTHTIHNAYLCGVERLLYLGSSCIYPKNASQPIEEDALFTGVLEPTNEAYALAKIGGVKMAQYYRAQYGCDFISAMPCNLFGVGDRYDVEASHVIPAMTMKAHKAKMDGDDVLTLWGTGEPLREFLDVADLANDLVFLLKNYSAAEPINVGSGFEISIKDLAHAVCDVVGFKGQIEFDSSKPDGVARKVLDNSRVDGLYGLCEQTRKASDMNSASFKASLASAYQDYRERYGDQ